MMSIKAFLDAPFILQHSLNVQRYFTIQIVNKISNNKFEIIEFDSTSIVLSHHYFDQVA